MYELSVNPSSPDDDVLNSMYSLLQHIDDIGDASLVLTPSAVVNTFCRQHSDCGETARVKRIVDFLETKILGTLSDDLAKRNNREKVF